MRPRPASPTLPTTTRSPACPTAPSCAKRWCAVSTRRGPRSGALIFLDIDHFKDVNDTLGHSVGDSFLDRNRATGCAPRSGPSDIISRHGGDEFVIVLQGADADRGRRRRRASCWRSIAEPVVVDGLSLPASASIGISLCPQDGHDTATLLRNADTAMYQAKSEGRNTYRFFSSDMNRNAQDRLLLGALLRDALIGNGQIVAALPAAGGCGDRRGDGRRGPRALDASGARGGVADTVHSARRGSRTDRRDRRIRAARGGARS